MMVIVQLEYKMSHSGKEQHLLYLLTKLMIFIFENDQNLSSSYGGRFILFSLKVVVNDFQNDS